MITTHTRDLSLANLFQWYELSDIIHVLQNAS